MNALLTLSEHPEGVTVGPGNRVVYDLDEGVAHYGAASVAGPALQWRLKTPRPDGKHGLPSVAGTLEVVVMMSGPDEWLMRCDRVDFPAGTVAYRHVHPGPGIRRLLFGELTVTTGGVTSTYRAGDRWFESGPESVVATSSPESESAFVRVMLLPSEWAGRRTIRYLDPADASRPALQRATVLLEEFLV